MKHITCKMKRHIRILAIAAMLMTVLCACGGKNSDDSADKVNNTDSNSVDIYCVKELEMVTSDAPYQLKQPDVLTSSVDELIAAMSENLSSDGLGISWYMLNSENILMINLDVPEDITKEKLLLIKASICNTLFQLDKLEGIELAVITGDEQEHSYESFNRTSFYMLKEE